jgi:predicted Zn-dependent protease
MLKKNSFQFAGYVLMLATIIACSKVPITGRKQMSLIPETELISMSLTEYTSFLKTNPPAGNHDQNTIIVKQIGNKIQQAVTKYMSQNKLSSRLAGYKWEFNLVNDPMVNAWCMPGGKVVVYSGLLGVTQNENALAIVMGHEIAHAVARHGNERMSQGLATQLGGIALGVALQSKSAETQALFQTVYVIGSTVALMLPYSRLHETEADKMGLIFAAMAGYDPREAPKFWQRMAAKGGAKTLEILSTHPSDARRISDLNKFMPQAMKYYKP